MHCDLALRTGFVGVVVERDQLRVSFHGLGGGAPLHVASVERSPAQRSLWNDGLAAIKAQVRTNPRPRADMYGFLKHLIEP